MDKGPEWISFHRIMEMQVKTTVKYYYVTVNIATIGEKKENQCWQGYGDHGTLVHW